MIKLDVEQSGLDEATEAAMRLPGHFARARSSALKSVGYMLRGYVQEHIRTGGGGSWEGAHPLSLKFTHGSMGRPKRRRRSKNYTPYQWLARLVRYRVNDKGSFLQVDIGRTGGTPGSYDRNMLGFVTRMAQGEKITVTEKMRGWMGLTRYRDPQAADKKPFGRLVVGETFFPLRKTTGALEEPPRPIFEPVWQRRQADVPGRFEERFWKALQRYAGRGGAKT